MVTISGNGGSQIAGENYTLTCTVTGGGTMPPTYRWFMDGTLLPGLISATLTFSPLSQNETSNYTCEATRSLSTATSTAMAVKVQGI